MDGETVRERGWGAGRDGEGKEMMAMGERAGAGGERQRCTQQTFTSKNPGSNPYVASSTCVSLSRWLARSKPCFPYL